MRLYRIPIGQNAAAKAPLRLPDKPSIAVLPFQNLSGDPEQEYFVDGMIEAAETAIRFTSGRRGADLNSDQMLLFALVRAIEIVSEAAGRVTEATREAAADVPWSLLVSMRNRLIHAYFDVDNDVVWKTVTEELPALLPKLRELL